MVKTTINNTPRPNPSSQLRFYKEGELKCAGPGCGLPMPEGYFGMKKQVYLCSPQCWNEYYIARRKPIRCTYCKSKFRKRHTQRSMPFCSEEHFYAWRRQQTEEKKVGAFTPIFRAFLDDCAPRFLAPASINNVRYNLGAFFAFLRKKRIRSLNSVTPKVITSFLVDLQKTRKKSAGRVVGDIRLLFDWLIMNGRRKTINPAVPRFHTQTAVTRLPRPYEAKELELIRSLVEESRDPRLQLAVAIGEESGLRISEVCNLRLPDIDLEKQQLFVRLPNKTNTERFTPFHTRTRNALIAWLDQRPTVDHDFLLTGTDDIPLRKHTLRLRLNRLLCGPDKLARFSFHRLRHTAASRVYPAMDPLGVMKTFGWKSEKVMQGYTRLLPETLRESYTRAMDQIEREAGTESLPPRSIEDYFNVDTRLK